jgi:hypothetical protein
MANGESPFSVILAADKGDRYKRFQSTVALNQPSATGV